MVSAAAMVIKIDHCFESLETPIVPVGKGACDLAQRRRLEVATACADIGKGRPKAS
jgi:hypothetical protein